MILSGWMKGVVFAFVTYTCTLSAELRLYVINQNDNTVSVIDTSTEMVIATITVGPGPFSITTSPAGDQLYVPNGSGNTVSVIDVATSDVTTITVGNGPSFVAFTATKAFVTNFSDNTVSVINVADQMVTDVVTVGAGPNFIATTPDGSAVYVLNFSGTTVNVINTSDLTTTAVTVGTTPSFIAFTASQAYVTNEGSNTVSVIDLASPSSVSATVTVGNGPNGIAITPDQTRAYVADSIPNNATGATSVDVIDTTTNPPAALSIAIGGVNIAPSFLAITPDGSQVYAPVFLSNQSPLTRGHTILEIDVSTNNFTTITESGTQTGPFFPAITPDGSKVYVVNDPVIGVGSVSVINTSQPDTIVATIPIGHAPQWAAFATFNTGPSAPSSPTGKQVGNCFFDQTDLVNVIQWNASTTGSPVQYKIYRDAALTDLAGTVPASELKFSDHNRKKNQTYTYYIIGVDGSGGTSSAAVVTVTPNANPC